MDQGRTDTVERSMASPGSHATARQEGRRAWAVAWRVLMVMCVLGAAYAGTILWKAHLATSRYPPLRIGMTEREVRYILGPPQAHDLAGSVYRYSASGREIAVGFSPQGRIDSVRCVGGQGPPTCPEIFGLGIGSSEAEVVRRLGAPSRQSRRGEEMTLHYGGMGLAFRIRQSKVRELELREGARFSGYFPRALWAAIP